MQLRFNVDATSCCFDVDTTLPRRHMPAGYATEANIAQNQNQNILLVTRQQTFIAVPNQSFSLNCSFKVSLIRSITD